ncbi:MAG: glycerophosphodiester phosphodiesterase [Psychromonas sp.]|nr:glycerophosphodiester phosphodiesterase [Psychromonas sp.]
MSETQAQPLLLQASPKIVIAHRGASGYLPEHSMESKVLAYAMGAHYIEQDVVMSKDNQLLVLHDHYLDRVTDVAEQFSQRARDGRYYALDFTLAEIKSLNMCERFAVKDNKQRAVFGQRFPLGVGAFKVHTLQEEIELIQGLNRSTGRQVGLYVEVKVPFFHRQAGKDISLAVLQTLKAYGYLSKQDLLYFQCFDADELKRVKEQLQPQLAVESKLVQLIAETSWQETLQLIDGRVQNYDYQWMREPGAMAEIAKYADAVGPWFPMLVDYKATNQLSRDNGQASVQFNGMVKEAHQAGLLVHPYVMRLDPGEIPNYATDFEHLLALFYEQAGVDGLFTDYPDRAVQYLNSLTL